VREPDTYSRSELEGIARDRARAYGVPPDGYVAQIGQESAWQWDAVSPAGAFGLAQFMPPTAKEWGVDVSDPVSSLDGGARYMAHLYSLFDDWGLALAAYNWGQGNVRRWQDGERSPPAETRAYTAKLAPAYGASDPFNRGAFSGDSSQSSTQSSTQSSSPFPLLALLALLLVFR